MAERDKLKLISDGSMAKVNDYVQSVVSGETIASRLVIASCQRHLSDMERNADDSFPYYFDAAYASRVIQFFPTLLKHSIGRFAGLPFDLEPWQAFQVASVFGWKQIADDTRRFRKWYCSVARKNGKSTLASGVAYFMAMADINPTTGKPESVAQVVLTATKKEQVIKVIYGEMQRMRTASSALVGLCTNINGQFSFRHNSGQVICVGSDKPFDGLNPSLVVSDELHEMREHHRKFYNTMTTGGAGREQPLHLITTTAGDDKSHIWLDEYKYCSGVCTGLINDESVFAFIAELDPGDNPLNYTLWEKANPNLGISVAEKYIRQAAAEGAESSMRLNVFTRYHCNRIVSSTEKAFDLERWDACEAELSDWKDADAVGCGIDLGGRDDLAACAFVARFPLEHEGDKTVYRYEVATYSYISEDTERDLSKAPFAEFVYQEQLCKCRYPISELQAKVIEQCDLLGTWGVAYDPAGALSVSETLAAAGINAVRMAQNCGMFNEPIKDFVEAIRDGRVSHNGSPLLRWCMNNAVLIRDRQDRWMFDKRDSSDKIDPVVAMVMAFRMASLAPERASGSLYI